MKQLFRIGQGCDLHRLVENRPLLLCGVKIPFEKGLLGHSDADAPLHALTDALLGALALGDIGHFFPDTDPAYKDADSRELLKKVLEHPAFQEYEIGNVDLTIIAQKPKLAPHILSMRESLAELLKIPPDCVSVKAKTNEGLGYLGRMEGIEANAVVLLIRKES